MSACADALMAVFGFRRVGVGLDLTLDWPPSVNRYWRAVRGRVLISAEGRHYRAGVARYALVNGFRSLGKASVSVSVVAFAPDRRKRDLDNLLKVPLDALTHAGIYDDDSQIDQLNIVRGPIDRQRPRIEILITTMEPSQ